MVYADPTPSQDKKDPRARAMEIMNHPGIPDSKFSDVMAERLREEPGLLDTLVTIPLAAVREPRLIAVWRAIVKLRPDLSGAFLDQACEVGQHRLENITLGRDLGRPYVRRAWLDFVERRTHEQNKNIPTLIAGALSVLDVYMRPSLGTVGDLHDPAGFFGDFAAALSKQNARAAIELSNRCLDNLADEFWAQTEATDPERLATLCRVLVEHGAELNTPHVGEGGITHPNRVHFLLHHGVQFGFTEDNALAAELVNLGGDWEEAWNDPALDMVAKKALNLCPVVRKTLLEQAADRTAAMAFATAKPKL